MLISLPKKILNYWPFFLGALFPLGFAPFNHAEVLFLILIAFFGGNHHYPHPFRFGFVFGLGLATTGLSWIYVSIHQYGHLHPIIAIFITLIFVCYIGTFYGLLSQFCRYLDQRKSLVYSPLCFASIWMIFEWARATLFGGFPWLLLGQAAIDSPFHRLLPVIGIYGTGLIMSWTAASIYLGLLQRGLKKLSLCLPIMLLLILKSLPAEINEKAYERLNTTLIQANVAMLEKWDEAYFWKNYLYYLQTIKNELHKNKLIILPEAAISAPSNYMHDELRRIDLMAKNKDSAIVLGIPQAVSSETDDYYNGSIALGSAFGHYYKQQLVPFGEYVPHLFSKLLNWLQVPIVNTISGNSHQIPIQIFKQPVASLICYELAYSEILRPQVEASRFIITMSDDAWFGHSLALHQHLQMARTLALMSHRFLIFANNNGLSSVINEQGQIVAKAPLWQKSNVNHTIHLLTQITPWVRWGDKPTFAFSLLILIMHFSWRIRRRVEIKNSVNLAIKA